MYPVSSIGEHSTDNRKTEERYLYWIPISSVRLSARTPAFHVGKMGSIPIRSAILKHITGWAVFAVLLFGYYELDNY